MTLDSCYFTLYVLYKLITPVVIATGQTFQFSWFFTASYLSSCIYPATLNRVRAAAKISAGGVGSPYNPSLVLTTLVKVSSVE